MVLKQTVGIAAVMGRLWALDGILARSSLGSFRFILRSAMAS
jgi:hypothetical protein